MADFNLEYHCSCGTSLEVNKDLRPELERGDEVILRCRKCAFLAVVKDRQIIEYIPPLTTRRWTETHY